MFKSIRRSTSCNITIDTVSIQCLWAAHSCFEPELTHINGRMCMSIFRTIRVSIALSFKCNDSLRQRTTSDVVAAAGPVQLS
jgi:hypothetical protein